MTRLLIVGAPRSGTTWVGEVLGSTDGAIYVNEPDGDHEPFAYKARRRHRIVPEMRPGDSSPNFERLWAGAFAGGMRSGELRDKIARRLYGASPVEDRWEVWLGGRESLWLCAAAAFARPPVGAPDAVHVVVKSVRAELCVDWIVNNFAPTVLLVERNPLNALSSWIELGYARDPRECAVLGEVARDHWGVTPPSTSAPLLTRQAFSFGVLAGALRDASIAHPEWRVVSHEELCTDPARNFQTLASDLGLTWNAVAAEHVQQADRSGVGYMTNRRSSEQPERWRERLNDDQVQEIMAALSQLPHDLFASDNKRPPQQ